MDICAVYVRASTDRQKMSIQNQHGYFQAYVKRHNYTVYNYYTDDALSGTDMLKRDAFNRLINDGLSGKFNILLAKSYSRFGRNQRETLGVISKFFDIGIRVILIEDNLNSLRDHAQFGLFAWLAEQESRKLSERIKIVWEHYNEKGIIHSAKAPYGYYYDMKSRIFKPHPEESKVIHIIFELYLQGYGVHKVTRILSDYNISARSGKPFANSSIHYILTNPVYIGTLIQGKTSTKDISLKGNVSIPKDKWYVHEDYHKPILKKETFYRVQQLLKKNRPNIKKSRSSNQSLYSNLLRCKICNNAMLTRKIYTNSGYNMAYNCGKYEQGGRYTSGHKRNLVYEELLNDILMKNFTNIISDPEKYIILDVPDEKSTHQLETVNNEIESINKITNKLLVAYSEGLIGDTQYRMQNILLEEQLAKLIKEKESLLIDRNIDKYVGLSKSYILKQITTLVNTPLEKWLNHQLKTIISHIEVDTLEGEIKVHYKFNYIYIWSCSSGQR